MHCVQFSVQCVLKLKSCMNCIYNIYLFDWLTIYGFTSRSRLLHLYGDVTITGEGLRNLGLCLALRAFEQGGILIVPHPMLHGASVFPVLSEGPSHSVASYDTRGCGGSILTRILTYIYISVCVCNEKQVVGIHCTESDLETFVRIPVFL
jgi:hypothetical protein